MFAWKRKNRSIHRLPKGERVYAIGDIHGEALLLERLLARILADTERRAPANTTLVLLGDIIDRGEDGVRLLLSLARFKNLRVRVLKGNHEATIVDCYHGDEDALNFWLHFGGRATLTGLGLSKEEIESADPAALIVKLRSSIDPQVIDWVDQLPSSWELGGYFFTHAGVQPGVALDRQGEEDLMWIREPFLSSPLDHGKVIVHGHTVEQGLPRLYGNRIGLDTGAHEHGMLTALGLQGDQQWLLQVSDTPSSGNISDVRSKSQQNQRYVVDAETSMKDRQGRFIEIMRLVSAITTDSEYSEENEAERLPRRVDEQPKWPRWRGHGDRTRSGHSSVALGFALAAGSVVGLSLISLAPWTPFGRPHLASPTTSPIRSSTPSRTAPAQPNLMPHASNTGVASSDQEPSLSPEQKRSLAKPGGLAKPERGSAGIPTHGEKGSPRIGAITADPPRLAVSGDSAERVRLTGAALEQALADDRIATRQLNEAELARLAIRR